MSMATGGWRSPPLSPPPGLMQPARRPEHWHVLVGHSFERVRRIVVRAHGDAEFEAQVERSGDPLRVVEVVLCADGCLK